MIDMKEEWIQEGIRKKCSHMLYLFDNIDGNCFPVYCDTAEDAIVKIRKNIKDLTICVVDIVILKEEIQKEV